MTEAMSSPMSVYLVPLGGERYELYCESADDEVDHDVDHDAPDDGDGSWFAGVRARFRSVLATAEAERQAGHAGGMVVANRTWSRRVRDRVMGTIVEAIAEQRLLWNLRGQADVCLVHPDDLTEARAHEIVRESLRRDADKHRLWLGVDVVAFGASGFLALIPGPNVIAYYFGFRLVGHFFSLRGARHGLAGIRWQSRASAPLADVRRAMELPKPERGTRLRAVADRLELRHLAAFVERLAASGAPERA